MNDGSYRVRNSRFAELTRVIIEPKGNIMSIEEYDAKWSADIGATLVETPIDEDCTPACESSFHLC